MLSFCASTVEIAYIVVKNANSSVMKSAYETSQRSWFDVRSRRCGGLRRRRHASRPAPSRRSAVRAGVRRCASRPRSFWSIRRGFSPSWMARMPSSITRGGARCAPRARAAWLAERQEDQVGRADAVDRRDERDGDARPEVARVGEVLHHVDQTEHRAEDADRRRVAARRLEHARRRFVVSSRLQFSASSIARSVVEFVPSTASAGPLAGTDRRCARRRPRAQDAFLARLHREAADAASSPRAAGRVVDDHVAQAAPPRGGGRANEKLMSTAPSVPPKTIRPRRPAASDPQRAAFEAVADEHEPDAHEQRRQNGRHRTRRRRAVSSRHAPQSSRCRAEAAARRQAVARRALESRARSTSSSGVSRTSSFSPFIIEITVSGRSRSRRSARR